MAFITTSTAIVQVKADPAMRGRVLALQGMVLIGSTPIGGPLLGWICDTYGARAGLLVGGVAAVAAGVWGYVMHRRIVESRTVDADPRDGVGPLDVGLIAAPPP